MDGISIWALVGGLFGGAGATILWEVFLRPVVVGRSVAEVLSAEISLNLELLAAVQSLGQKRTGIPADLSLSTVAFDSLTDRIGDLPPNLIGEVVFLYKYFHELNSMPKAWIDGVKELRGYGATSANYKSTERELRQLIGVFRQYVQKSVDRTNLVQPTLLKAAAPWWSIRGRRRRQPLALDVGALERRMDSAMQERQLFLDEER